MSKGARRFVTPASKAHEALYRRAGGYAAGLPPDAIAVTSAIPERG
jgi:hypothetical protein